MTDAVADPRTYQIIGAAMEVHRELGGGFLEAVYQEAFELELDARGIPAKREAVLPIKYKGRTLSTKYRVDFLCFDSVLVETKAVQSLSAADEAQLLNYLKAADMHAGLLINFAGRSLDFRRLVYGPSDLPSVSVKSD